MFNDGGRMKDIVCGNPTCPHCGVTYGIAEIHNCFAKIDYVNKQREVAMRNLEIDAKNSKMTLRDQFAMAGLAAGVFGCNKENAAQIAEQAYLLADAMLKQREEGRE